MNTRPAPRFLSGPTMADLFRFGVRFAPPDEGAGGSVEEPDEEEGSYLDDEEGDEAFLSNITKEVEATSEAEPETDPAQSAETPETNPETQPEPVSAADEALVEVKVGEETHKVAVKDLKRLFGQEASLTRKAQEVAQERETLRQRAEHSKTVLAKALERAEARFKPYAEMDFLVAAKRLDEESLRQLRQDASEAHQEVEFLRSEMDEAKRTVAEVDQTITREAARAAVQDLSESFPKDFGEQWSDALYGQIMEFAEAKGLKNARTIVDAGAIRLMRMAMLYERGKTLAAEKIKKVAPPPQKPMRSGVSGAAKSENRDAEAAMTRLRRSGSVDDAEAAFMARLRPADA